MTRIAKHLFLPAVPAPPTVGPEDAVEEWERVPELDTEGGHVWQDMSDIRGLSVRVPLAVEQAIRAEAEARSDRAWKVWAESRLSANAADLRDWMQAHGEAEARATAAEAQVEGLRAALAAEVEHYDGLKTGARRRMNYDFGDIYESVADRLRALAGESTGAGEGE
ncbi:MAG: hypothetical protein M0R75_13660 [Dehalococcoidia bacterium]|nr:hypothetical protein [Dehalococcoidia bacterium]